MLLLLLMLLVLLVAPGPLLVLPPAAGAPPGPRPRRAIILPQGRAALLQPAGIAVPPAAPLVGHPLTAVAQKQRP